MHPLIDEIYLLQRYEGKGGWTYAVISGITRGKGQAHNVRVKGTIDGYPIEKYHLMPMSDGNLFLPVRAEIRKKIGKQAGNTVHIVLYHDNDPLEVPGELLLCLQDEPKALKFFNKLSESERKYYIQWIYAAKKEETKANRIAKIIDKMARGLKMYDKEL